jgi:hypothetical protein
LCEAPPFATVPVTLCVCAAVATLVVFELGPPEVTADPVNELETLPLAVTLCV